MFNWLENFVIKRIVKKVIKGFPTLKAKGVDFFWKPQRRNYPKN